MKGFHREDLLFSLCGLNCGLCSMRLGGYCPGCGGGEGNQSCKIAKCSLEHGNQEYCSRCGAFPCEKYERVDEADSFITHLHQKSDIQKQMRIGEEAYRREQKEKADILGWLLQYFNDGRKKTFFSLAVNLLELEDLRGVREQAGMDGKHEEVPIKERAALVKTLLEERGIVLKLRKRTKQDGEGGAGG